METEWLKLALASVPGLVALVTAISGYATLREKVRRMEMDVDRLVSKVTEAVDLLRKEIRLADHERAGVCKEHMDIIIDVNNRLIRLESRLNGTH